MTLDIVIFGLSITSSWGNGHATTYRALIKALAARGHRITFLERDVPWYRDNRDLCSSPHCRIELYDSLRCVSQKYGALVTGADVVVLGSFVPDGAVLGDWITSTAQGVTAFYDIDTPVTLSRLESGNGEYICAPIIPRFNLYLSFTGGPTLQLIEEVYGSPRARPLYCAVDVTQHAPVDVPARWALGYIGTYSEDRQPLIERLLFETARRLPDERFVVVGAQYPKNIAWPENVEQIEHLPPDSHSEFYCSQRYTLNLTRPDMVAAGFSPSVRLFEAGACAVPVISDVWPGIERFFVPGEELLLADTSDSVVQILTETPEIQRRRIATAARNRVLHSHTAGHRAAEFERYVKEVMTKPAGKAKTEAA
ncbi:MAG TPA: glycosyltransferase [Xanthobacteraceae bacterium]|nr:glycosyltransferase [Xanthobacteraceae bacterium]